VTPAGCRGRTPAVSVRPGHDGACCPFGGCLFVGSVTGFDGRDRCGGRVKYMLLICGDESARVDDGCGGWAEEMTRRGVLVGGAGLRPPAEARTVRVRERGVLVVDGPFAETREQIGGYCLIDCADLDEAIEIVSRHPAAGYGTVEIRPLWPL
jgi:hypothetical protein